MLLRYCAQETRHDTHRRTADTQLLGEEVDEVVIELDFEKPMTDMADWMLSSLSWWSERGEDNCGEGVRVIVREGEDEKCKIGWGERGDILPRRSGPAVPFIALVCFAYLEEVELLVGLFLVEQHLLQPLP
jgi:hypothetical protein